MSEHDFSPADNDSGKGIRFMGVNESFKIVNRMLPVGIEGDNRFGAFVKQHIESRGKRRAFAFVFVMAYVQQSECCTEFVGAVERAVVDDKHFICGNNFE
jgi:hypothetical protein